MPSKILTLVCLAIVRRFRPAWVAVTIQDAAQELQVNPQRVSRLATQVQRLFDQVLTPFIRRGRPPRDRDAAAQTQQLALTQALLSVATQLLAHMKWRRPVVRALVVGAYLRLKQDHPRITQQSFCEALALPSRTLRHWLTSPKPTEAMHTPVAPSPEPKTPRSRPPRRPRFGFQVVLPATQLTADTTTFSVLGCTLKLIATQDVGGRELNLLESVIIDDHESAELVIQAFIQAIAGREGFQATIDQGTPYMAQATQQALEELGAEHTPQAEGTPTDKATIERAFASIKSIAAPLFSLSDRLASRLPELKTTPLAVALATLVVSALLKAYQAGARAQQRATAERQELNRDELFDVAQEHRERSRAEDRSRRLLLGEIHDCYDLPRPKRRFVRSLRRYPLVVLQRAERRFRSQVHRDDIRNRAAYFSAIVRNVHDEYRADQARRKAQQAEQRRQQAREAEQAAQRAARQASPATWLQEALVALAEQWQPATRDLLFGGAGIGRRWLIDALELLVAKHGPDATRSIAEGAFNLFTAHVLDRIGQDGVAAIRAVLDEQMPPSSPTPPQSRCTQEFVATILGLTGPDRRSAPDGALSNSSAEPGGS